MKRVKSFPFSSSGETHVHHIERRSLRTRRRPPPKSNSKSQSQELHRYGGGLMETEARDPSSVPPEMKQGIMPSKTPADTVVASLNSAPYSDSYHIGVPDKISRIYGDWIDDIE
ncbi:hypothetical protein Vadar_013278 [Vaccinium darrowii]|uniref:Uncharacterized protein n=1 Tax=Vaccinium darrowii TaxID=229202 RepID=A0ACB7YW63_9ERIC|nr:hypothetical protein Vadar_013278 [Vaccinium darrowii]